MNKSYVIMYKGQLAFYEKRPFDSLIITEFTTMLACEFKPASEIEKLIIGPSY